MADRNAAAPARAGVAVTVVSGDASTVESTCRTNGRGADACAASRPPRPTRRLAPGRRLGARADRAAPGARPRRRRRPRCVQRSIVVPKDKSAAFRLDYPVSEIVVAQPDTPQLVATTDHSFYVRGKAARRHQHPDLRRPAPPGAGGRRARRLRRRLACRPTSPPPCRASTSPPPTSPAASCSAARPRRPRVAARAEAIAERYAPKACHLELTVHTPSRCRSTCGSSRPSRSTLKDLGFNLNVSGPATSASTLAPGTPASSPQAPIRRRRPDRRLCPIDANWTRSSRRA